jgi:antitoxin ParD1/3/4
MPTRNLVLTDHHERLIADLVGSGRYQNASEILREGLRLIEERELREAAKLGALRAAARTGFADFAAGRYRDIEGDDALDDMIGELGREAAHRLRDPRL